MRRFSLVALALITLLALFGTAYHLAYRSALTELSRRGETALVLVQERLTLQLERHRYLPSVLAQDPRVRGLLAGEVAPARTNRFLQRIGDTSGALDIYVKDASGTTIAASNWDLPRSFVGTNYAWRPYFKRAVRGGLGFYHAVGVVSNQRGFYFSHPVYSDAGAIAGVITVKIDLERIESQWRGDFETLFFTDRNDVIFLANRPDLVLRQLTAKDISDPRQYAGRVLEPLAEVVRARSGVHQIWRGAPGLDLPDEALYLTAPVPTLEMEAHILVDAQAARTQALLWGGVALLLGGTLWLIAAIVMQRRAVLAAQLRIEERARSELELKVAQRTKELEEVQAQLVQAGKLTALGEMSAGISHELNQPLTAIQSLADNAEILMERGRMDDVRGNMDRIAQLAGRMGRIIRNLRSFARNEEEVVSDVDLVEAARDALAIARPKIEASGTRVTADLPLVPVWVRGGRVRLQQVLVNLISNAVDAMEGQADKHMELTLSRSAGRVHLVLRDNGPGLTEPQRIFDPFYTTKTVGEGLGLGLSISYGIIQSFGGAISGETHQDGGAVFEVELLAAKMAQEAG